MAAHLQCTERDIACTRTYAWCDDVQPNDSGGTAHSAGSHNRVRKTPLAPQPQARPVAASCRWGLWSDCACFQVLLLYADGSLGAVADANVVNVT